MRLKRQLLRNCLSLLPFLKSPLKTFCFLIFPPPKSQSRRSTAILLIKHLPYRNVPDEHIIVIIFESKMMGKQIIHLK